MKPSYFFAAAIVATTFLPLAASAHVVVKPDQAGIGSFQTFSIGVPTEKDIPTVSLRLVIPNGVKEVSPNVKPGWTIKETKSTTAEDADVTEISWSAGQIPAGQRDEFMFNAQVPSKPTDLEWKAYQTYADGSVVAWDKAPSGKDEEGSTPLSITKVVNDLTPAATAPSSTDGSGEAKAALVMSMLALVLSIGALVRKRSNPESNLPKP